MRSIPALASLACMAILEPATAHAATITATPDVIYLDVGESADVEIGVSLQVPTDTIDTRFSFAADIVSSSAVVDLSLCIVCFFVSDGTAGAHRVGLADIFPLAEGALEFDFALVTFTGLAPGVTDVVLDLYPANGPPDNAGEVLVRIVVPEPRALTLLAILAVLTALRLRSALPGAH